MSARFPVVVASFALALAGVAVAGPKKESRLPDPASIAKSLDDADPVVREAAAVALISQGDAALGALKVTAESPLRRGSAARSVAAIDRANRLASKPKESVAWWMAVEDIVEHETGATRDAILGSAIGDRYLVDLAIEKRSMAQAAVIAFCREWSHDVLPMPGSPGAATRAAVEERIRAAGAAAAPHLFRRMASNHVKRYFEGYGSISWTMVAIRAVHAARILRLREAVPFFLYQATSMSPTASGAAEWAVDEVAGTSFAKGRMGNVFGLDSQTAPAVDWWKAHRAEYTEGLGYLVEAALDEVHADLATRLVTGAEPDGNEIAGSGFESYEEAMAKRLAVVVGAELPLQFSGDTAARLETVRAARVWAATKFPQ